MSSGAMTCPAPLLQRPEIAAEREITNLSLRENEQEKVCNIVSGAPRSDEQHRANGVESTRLDEHGDDGLAQSTDPSYPQCSTAAPRVQDEPDDNHESEEDVE